VNRFGPGVTSAVRLPTRIRSKRIGVPAGEGLTHLRGAAFRWVRVCRVHLRSVARRHVEIVAAGICDVVVFHCSAEDILPHQGELSIPLRDEPKLT